MADYIDREELLKKAYVFDTHSNVQWVSAKDIKSMPTVKAITIDRLAEIMAEETEHTPCDFISESCYLRRKCPKDFKVCWKEFFKHYAEVEE